ncbi:MAG: ferric ABC transporter ATP-binding protein [Candidatus Abyssubacteria bacterium]
MQSEPIYELRDVTKRYGNGIVLDVPTLSFAKGETCALVGPNGSGKTTLLRILGLIEKPTSGTLLFDAQLMWNGPADQRLSSRRITMVTQPPYLFNRSVAYNITYGLKLRGVPRRETRRRVSEVLEIVGLSGFEKRDARKLSSGEQQRVAIARALALQPEVLLLDEPTANIDKRHAEMVESVIARLAAEQSMTVIFSTHNEQQAVSLANRIVSMHDGRTETIAYENFFTGIISDEGGHRRIRLNSSVSFGLVSGAPGPATVSIDPCAVTVSREPAPDPLFNCLQGTITSMAIHGSGAKLTLDVGVKLISFVPGSSLQLLRPSLGEKVYCIFDRTSLKII